MTTIDPKIEPQGEPVSEKTSLKERVMTALADAESSLRDITTLDQLNDVVYHVMDSLPESIELASQIQLARQAGNQILEAELVAQQLMIYTDISGELSLISGIETDQSRVMREDQEYRRKIANKFQNVDIAEIDSGEILTRLGMLQPNENNELVFTFPRETFPPHICEKWDHYIDIVARHVASEGLREEGQDNVRDITVMNSYRTQAHNNLSQSIKDFLGMGSWDLEKCRRLVIKMRDAKMPNIETAERETTANEIARLISLMRDITKNK